jgi:hypothetical protein
MTRYMVQQGHQVKGSHILHLERKQCHNVSSRNGMRAQELRRNQAQETIQLSSLQNKRQETRACLELDQQTLQQKLQTALAELKVKKPELFYITGTEQIAKLATHIIQWLLS